MMEDDPGAIKESRFLKVGLSWVSCIPRAKGHTWRGGRAGGDMGVRSGRREEGGGEDEGRRGGEKGGEKGGGQGERRGGKGGGRKGWRRRGGSTHSLPTGGA